jgi:hypothetical protein
LSPVFADFCISRHPRLLVFKALPFLPFGSYRLLVISFFLLYRVLKLLGLVEALVTHSRIVKLLLPLVVVFIISSK